MRLCSSSSRGRWYCLLLLSLLWTFPQPMPTLLSCACILRGMSKRKKEGEEGRLRKIRQEELKGSSRSGTTTTTTKKGITTPLVFSRGLLVWCFAFPFVLPSSCSSSFLERLQRNYSTCPSVPPSLLFFLLFS